MQKIEKNLNFKSGIYMIINLINNKKYIGSSKNIYSRIAKHRSLLRKNKHYNKKFQNSWNKYNEEFFKYVILEYCEEYDLLIKEQYYINILNPELNITLSVERNVLSKESRKLQSETRKKRIKSGEIEIFGKEIHQYDLNGKYIKSYKFIKQACIDNNIHQSSICRFLNGTYKKGGNYLWSLEYKKYLNPYIKHKKPSLKLNKKVQVLNYYTKELVYEFNSLQECAKFFNCHNPSISYAIKVKQKFYKKYLIIIAALDSDV